jgi:hypothetical protein
VPATADLGVSAGAVDRFRGSLERAVRETSEDQENATEEAENRLQEQVRSLIDDLTDELNRQYD